MSKTSGILFGLFLFLSIESIHSQPAFAKDSFIVHTQNDREILLLLFKDNEKIPQYYGSDIFTQVCETGECKPVRILLFWDLLGKYTHYEMPEGSILTKLDHVPFSDADYQKFGSILLDPYSPLEDLEINELTSNKEKASVAEIDGITGATPKSISNAIVDGAVYTCYTLWHLAHGELPARIIQMTDSILSSEESLADLLKSGNLDYRRWATQKIMIKPDQYSDLVQIVLEDFDPKNIFMAKFILRSLPESILKEVWSQEILWSKYPFLTYDLQLILLERYQTIPLDWHLKDSILSNQEGGNYNQKSMFDRLSFQEKGR